MIHINQDQSVIEPTRQDKKIFKRDLVENAMYKEWEIDKIKRFGSVQAYWEQYESGEDYFTRIGWN